MKHAPTGPAKKNISRHETHAAGEGSASSVRRLCLMQHQTPDRLNIKVPTNIIKVVTLRTSSSGALYWPVGTVRAQRTTAVGVERAAPKRIVTVDAGAARRVGAAAGATGRWQEQRDEEQRQRLRPHADGDRQPPRLWARVELPR